MVLKHFDFWHDFFKQTGIRRSWSSTEVFKACYFVGNCTDDEDAVMLPFGIAF